MHKYVSLFLKELDPKLLFITEHDHKIYIQLTLITLVRRIFEFFENFIIILGGTILLNGGIVLLCDLIGADSLFWRTTINVELYIILWAIGCGAVAIVLEYVFLLIPKSIGIPYAEQKHRLS